MNSKELAAEARETDDGSEPVSQTEGARVTPFPGRPVDDQSYTTWNDRAERKPQRWWMLAVLVLIVAGAAWWFLREPAASQAATTASTPTPLELSAVDIGTVEPRVLARSLPISGSISPVVQATVKAKVGGEIEVVTVREGQDVRAGDVIARVDTRNLQAQFDREQAAVEKARADLDLATLNRDKNRTLLEQKYISQNTFEQTESAHAASVASYKLAQASARLAQISLEDAVIRAPFAGIVSRRLVQPGEKVSPDSSIVGLVDLRQMLLEASVPAADIPTVEVGQNARFRVTGFGERLFEGKVQRINPVTTEGSRSITVYIAIPNDDRALKGGMFGQGQLVLDTKEPLLSVPASAVKQESGVPVVYTLVDGKIARQQVTLGIQVEGGQFVEVRDGLKAGDRVILTDLRSAKPGDPAKLRGEAS